MTVFIIVFLSVVALWTILSLRTYRKNSTSGWRISLIASVLTLFTLTFLTFWIYNYPSTWDNLSLGKKRSVTHQNVGYPDVDDLWDVKADIWIDKHLFSWHRLDVLYNTDTVARDYMLVMYIGTKDNFVRIPIKNSFDNQTISD